MANENNLRSLGDLTTREQREIAKMGGKASVASRRRARDQRTLALNLIKSIPTLDKSTKESLRTLGIKGKGKDHDVFDLEMLGMAAIIQKMLRGDVKAYRLYLEIIGEDGASVRDRERFEHEREMVELENNPPEQPDDGFLDALEGMRPFDDVEPDVPMDIDEGEDDRVE